MDTVSPVSGCILCLVLFSLSYAVELGCLGDTCYQLFYATLTWNDSRSVCTSLHPDGDLAMIKDQATHDFIAAELNALTAAEAWVGAKAVLDTWSWQDGTPYSWTRWDGGYPKNFNYAASFSVSDYLWRDEQNPFPYRYICNGTPELCAAIPEGYIQIDPSTGLCLIAYTGNMGLSWQAASYECQIMNTTLATVDDEATFEAIRTELRKYSYTGAYWIGLHRESWQWVDGTTVGYNQWSIDSPDTPDGCMLMKQDSDSSYLWHDELCVLTKPSVCELPYVSTDSIDGST